METITGTCGCTLKSSVHGVLISLDKCEFHKSQQLDPALLDESYYKQHVDFAKVLSGTSPHVYEMASALGGFPISTGGECLEIGCGISPYLAELIKCGYRPSIIEPSNWAANWCREEFDAVYCGSSWLYTKGTKQYNLILSAHSFEHMEAPFACLYKMAEWLLPDGLLYLLIPEGTDITNPDHLSFWTQESLVCAVQETGLIVETCVTKSIIPKERFIYLKAKKIK